MWQKYAKFELHKKVFYGVGQKLEQIANLRTSKVYYGCRNSEVVQKHYREVYIDGSYHHGFKEILITINYSSMLKYSLDPAACPALLSGVRRCEAAFQAEAIHQSMNSDWLDLCAVCYSR